MAQKRTEVLTVWLTRREHRQVTEFAASLGITASAFLRSVLDQILAEGEKQMEPEYRAVPRSASPVRARPAAQ